MISAKNYAAQAEAGIKRWASTFNTYQHSNIDVNNCIKIANLIKEAVHFSIPDNGKLFDDDLKGIIGLQVRLPYPVITVEYFVEESAAPYTELATLHSPRRLCIAYESDKESFRKEAKYDTQNKIIVNRSNDYLSSLPDDKFIHIFVANEIKGQWMLCQMSFIMPITWDYVPHKFNKIDDNVKKPLYGMPFAVLPGIYSHLVDEIGEHAAMKSSMHDIGGEISALLGFCEALTCSNVTTETIQYENKKLNGKRISKGKLPIYETKTLVIEVPKSAKNHGAGLSIDRSSPRQHLRRGHIRRLSNDKRIWVNSCVVGSSDLGNIHKSYSVVPKH